MVGEFSVAGQDAKAGLCELVCPPVVAACSCCDCVLARLSFAGLILEVVEIVVNFVVVAAAVAVTGGVKVTLSARQGFFELPLLIGVPYPFGVLCVEVVSQQGGRVSVVLAFADPPGSNVTIFALIVVVRHLTLAVREGPFEVMLVSKVAREAGNNAIFVGSFRISPVF